MRGIGTVLGLVAFGPKLANKTLDTASDGIASAATGKVSSEQKRRRR